MLGIMRKYKQSIIIKIVFGIIVLSFIGTIFLVWGRGDGETGPTGYAAKVNGTRITVDEYQKAYYRLRGMYEQIYGRSMTPEMEKQLGLKKQALDSLVDNLLMQKEAKKMGIKVTKDEVQSAIAAIPAFQKDGAFDFQQYQATLKANRISSKEFEAGQEEELRVKKAREKITGKVTVTDEEALQNYKKENDKIQLQYVSFSPAEVKGSLKLTEQDLTTYLQGHQEQFRRPEQVSLGYCLLDPAKVAGKVTVTDEEAETFYRKNMDRYQGKGEILPFAEVKDRVKADARQAKAAKEAYEMAADALNKNMASADLKTAASSLGAPVEETPLFTSASPPPQLLGEAEVIKRAFSLKQGEMGGPVETSRGIYLLKVKEKKPATVPPLAEIRPQVEARALEAKAQEEAKKQAEQALAAFTKGDAKGKETAPFGYNPKGNIPAIGTAPEMMEAAFALSSTAPVPKSTFKVGDSWYAVRLKNRIAADTAEFQKTKEQLKKSLLPKKQQDALEAWIKDLRNKTKIDINTALIAEN